MKVTTILPKEPVIPTGKSKEQPLTNIPAVPVLRSPPPIGSWVHQTQPPLNY